MRTVLASIVLTLSILAPAHASSDTTRIDGVAQFLIDRANDNYLYTFEKKIRDDKEFACYFPETRATLEVSGLKQLLYSRGIWANSISKDLNILATRSIATALEHRLALSDKSVQLTDWNQALQSLAIEYQGQHYPLDSIPLNIDPKLQQLINGFSDPLGDIVVALNVFRKYKEINICDMPAINLNKFKQEIDALIKLPETVSRFSEHLKQHADMLVVSEKAYPAICNMLNLNEDCNPGSGLQTRLLNSMQERLNALLSKQTKRQFDTDIAQLTILVDTYQDPKVSTTTKVVIALKAIQQNADAIPGEIENLSRHIMFFAQVSDSSSPEEVKNLLSAYTLPSVSFYTKREHSSHWMITSYFGISGGKTLPDSSSDRNNSGMFAPVGIEWSHGTSGKGSINIMLAPFDFSYPISLKLNGIEQDAKLSDIVAPSLSVSYGLPDYPIVVGIAYQYGRLIEATGQQEKRLMLFLVFDMPLFPLN